MLFVAFPNNIGCKNLKTSKIKDHIKLNEMMVEVFKTNVQDGQLANVLVEKIQQNFSDYHANFDLDDCDKILRVCNVEGSIHPELLIRFLQKYNCEAEVLTDESGVEENFLKNFLLNKQATA